MASSLDQVTFTSITSCQQGDINFNNRWPLRGWITWLGENDVISAEQVHCSQYLDKRKL